MQSKGVTRTADADPDIRGAAGQGYDGSYDAVRRYARRWSKAAVYCPNPFPSEEEAKKQLDPLIAYLTKVSLCGRAGICDDELSSILYCTDATNVRAATWREGNYLVVSQEAREYTTDVSLSFEGCHGKAKAPFSSEVRRASPAEKR